MSTKELHQYRPFTKPAELHKAINTLKGIVAGITTDRSPSETELHELLNWCTLHEHLRDRHPFSELLPLIDDANVDGIITMDEAKDIVWLCNNFISDTAYYDLVTSSLQFLTGLLHGIMADGVLTNGEIHTLRNWIDMNDYLRSCYPFDEIESLLISTLADGRVDAEERNILMAFFSNFIDTTASQNIHAPKMEELRAQYSVDGICAVCPDITFDSKRFCFTGESRRLKRSEIVEKIISAGGLFRASVNNSTDYLVVGAAGNPCWAYACYGRKIEEAMHIRKSGIKLVIVHENDLWDALENL
jgi:hypothetical protein